MTATPTLVNYEVQDGLGLLTLSQSPANAYSYAMMLQLDAAILAARMDESVHVIVLTGAGEKFFCAGADIEMLANVTPAFKYAFCLHANETLNRLEQTSKLVIGVLNGHCVGGGLEVAMACDIRIGRRGDAKIGLPEVRLGVLPGTGGTQRLTRLIGKALAIEMIVTGRNHTFEEAHELGLINRLIDGSSHQDFMSAALEYARGFCPPNSASKAVGLIKRACQSGSEASLETGLALERELQQQLFMSDDASEGIAAYNERRKPTFKGQ